MNLYLVSTELLLTAVSPVGGTAAPAVTAGWTPLSVASFASAGSYTVNNSPLNQHFYSPWSQVFLRVPSNWFSHSSASSGPQSCTQFNLSRVYILKLLGSLPSDWRLSLLVTLNGSRQDILRTGQNPNYLCKENLWQHSPDVMHGNSCGPAVTEFMRPALKFVLEILFKFFVDINCIKCTIMSLSYRLHFIWKA